MMAVASRVSHARARARGLPPWLERAREMIHAHFRGSIQLVEIAVAVGVTPWHLARTFRRHFGQSIGEYARALRLNWALDQLVRTETPISKIAVIAGFSDQSHFTRACAGAIGMTPADYRRTSRQS
jgi:AraC family transcriptional regulator